MKDQIIKYCLKLLFNDVYLLLQEKKPWLDIHTSIISEASKLRVGVTYKKELPISSIFITSLVTFNEFHVLFCRVNSVLNVQRFRNG